jgi:hypothetical protein
MLLITLCTCCTTEGASEYLFVMTWFSHFSDDSASLQYFRNPGSGTSAILVYTQFHRLLFFFRTALRTTTAGR